MNHIFIVCEKSKKNGYEIINTPFHHDHESDDVPHLCVHGHHARGQQYISVLQNNTNIVMSYDSA